MKFKKIAYLGLSEPINVSEDGKVIEYKEKVINQTLIKAKTNRHGFYQVYIEGKVIYVHRLVAMAFVHNPKPISYKMVLHKNCVSTDNHYKNIEWGNNAMLVQNRINNGLAGSKDLRHRGSSSISHADAVDIARRLDNGEYAKDICIEYGVSEMSIARIRKRYCQTKSKSPRYAPEIKMNVIRLCQKHSPGHVAKITQIPYHTVWRWYKNSDVAKEKEQSED
ncbi:hypothetical protein E9993_09965 [Labilibacter sediminis]|nr:hypothetical protein E9993_09965 [Labilibacter sediminis]